MYDLQSIQTMNAPQNTRLPNQRIYDIGNGKYALAQGRGYRSTIVVRRISNRKDALGRGLPTYRGVQARKPVIPDDAKLVTRDSAGRLLLRALGLRG